MNNKTQKLYDEIMRDARTQVGRFRKERVYAETGEGYMRSDGVSAIKEKSRHGRKKSVAGRS